MYIPEITSPTNPKIKDLVRLKDRKGERAEECFVVEGLREINRAFQSGFELLELYQCLVLIPDLPKTLVAKTYVALTYISQEAFQKVAVREGSDGLIAVFKARTIGLESLTTLVVGKVPLIVAAEDVEKPGNLGAILRTADAAGVHAVVVLDQAVDPWNQHVIRASLGGVFSVPVIHATSEEFFAWCQKNKVSTVAAALSQRSSTVFKQNLKEPTAILLGSEARGLSKFWFENATHLAQIPMFGVCDSLNVSVAAAVFIYEAVRQRT